MLYRGVSFVMPGSIGVAEDYKGLGLQQEDQVGVASKGYGRYHLASRQGASNIRSGKGCGRVRWSVRGGVWAVATGWRVSSGDPQMFRFICFYSSLYSRVFPRSSIIINQFSFSPPTYCPTLLTGPLTLRGRGYA